MSVKLLIEKIYDLLSEKKKVVKVRPGQNKPTSKAKININVNILTERAGGANKSGLSATSTGNIWVNAGGALGISSPHAVAIGSPVGLYSGVQGATAPTSELGDVQTRSKNTTRKRRFRFRSGGSRSVGRGA